MITMEDLLALLVRKGGSDLHISCSSPPRIRVDGILVPVDHPPLTAEDTRRLATSVLTHDQIAKLDRDNELDCSFGLEGQGRFRANVFFQQGSVACVLRLVPHEIANFEQLGLPADVCERLVSEGGCRGREGLRGAGIGVALARAEARLRETRDMGDGCVDMQYVGASWYW